MVVIKKIQRLGVLVGAVLSSLIITVVSYLSLVLVPPIGAPPTLQALEEQMAEARATAKLGHQIALNIEAVENFQPGDIIRFEGALWSVRDKMICGNWIISRLDHDQSTISPRNRSNMLPSMLQNVYKRGTDEWSCAAKLLVCEGLGKNFKTEKYQDSATWGWGAMP